MRLEINHLTTSCGKSAKTRSGRYKSDNRSRGRKRPLSSIIESETANEETEKCTEAGRSKLRVHRLENSETKWKFQQELSRRFKEAKEKVVMTLKRHGRSSGWQQWRWQRG